MQLLLLLLAWASSYLQRGVCSGEGLAAGVQFDKEQQHVIPAIASPSVDHKELIRYGGQNGRSRSRQRDKRSSAQTSQVLAARDYTQRAEVVADGSVVGPPEQLQPPPAVSMASLVASSGNLNQGLPMAELEQGSGGMSSGARSNTSRGDWDFIAKKISEATGVTSRSAREIFYPAGNLELADLRQLFGMPPSAGSPFLWGGRNHEGFRVSMSSSLEAGVEGLGYLISDTPAGHVMLHPDNPMPQLSALRTASMMQAELVATERVPVLAILINKVHGMEVNNLILTSAQAHPLIEILEKKVWKPKLTIYNQVPLDDEDDSERYGHGIPCSKLLANAVINNIRSLVGSGFACVNCGPMSARDCLRKPPKSDTTVAEAGVIDEDEEQLPRQRPDLGQDELQRESHRETGHAITEAGHASVPLHQQPLQPQLDAAVDAPLQRAGTSADAQEQGAREPDTAIQPSSAAG